MGLDWFIQVNGNDDETSDEYKDNKLPCNGMTLTTYLDGTTAHRVAELGLDPLYPIWPIEMAKGGVSELDHPKRTLDAADMRVIARMIVTRAKCSEHLRIAAWLSTWAEEDEPHHNISLYISY